MVVKKKKWPQKWTVTSGWHQQHTSWDLGISLRPGLNPESMLGFAFQLNLLVWSIRIIREDVTLWDTAKKRKKREQGKG